MAYNAFTKTVVLTEVMRRQGNVFSACQCREVLNQLRDRPLLRENWQLFLSRSSENLDITVHTKFSDVPHLYPTKDKTTASNLQCLEQLEQLEQLVLKPMASILEKCQRWHDK